MILANKWDSKEGKMTVNANDHYTIMCGEKFLNHSSTGKEHKLQLTELESEDGCSNEFEFLLTPRGLVVGAAERALVAVQHGQAEGGQHELLWEQVKEEQNNIWNLVPIDFRGEEPQFCVELPEGDKRPRLVQSSSGKGVMVTTRDQDGYFEQSQTAWKIVKTN